MGKLLASHDSLALDGSMARMMGVDPTVLPVQKEGLARGLGVLQESEITIHGQLTQIPDFKMPVTFSSQELDDESKSELRKLYPPETMATRVTVKPQHDKGKCIECNDCVLNCPAEVLTLEPEFHISDDCIACYCCVELCPEGALEVPDVEAFRHY